MADISVDVDDATAATTAVTAALDAFDVAAEAAAAAQAALVPYNGSPEQATWNEALVNFGNATRQLVIDAGTLNDLIVAAIEA
jgi:hypothetical protein